jgi:hypothetical protein
MLSKLFGTVIKLRGMKPMLQATILNVGDWMTPRLIISTVTNGP